MVSCHEHDQDHHTHDREFLQIKQDNKFFSRLLSKESSRANSSCRDRSLLFYYGGSSAGAVPFLWESQPGTPKQTLSGNATSLTPPLTPPPSYQNHRSDSKPSGTNQKLPTILFGAILFPTRKKRTHVSPSSVSSASPWSSASSSSSWSCSSPTSYFGSTAYPKSKSLRTHVRYEDEYWSPTSTLICCGGGVRRRRGGWKRFNGCFPVAGVVKTALMSLVGHHSSGHRGRA